MGSVHVKVDAPRGELAIASDGTFHGEFDVGAGRTVSLNGEFTDGVNVSGSARAEGGGDPQCTLMQWTAQPMGAASQ